MGQPGGESKLETGIPILCVEPGPGERDELQHILRSFVPTPQEESAWKVWTVPGVPAAPYAARNLRTPIVLCDSQPVTGTWQQLLAALAKLPDPPLLIVTSRVADERLWAEALNLGAHDVLAKPYEKTELLWVLNAALRCWRQQRERKPAQTAHQLVMRAAS